jgi:ankyrin repeat protein
MGSFARVKTMSRWLYRAALVALMVSLGIASADAQSGPPTPFSTTPSAPKTFPLIGGQPLPDNAPHLLMAVAAKDSVGVATLLDAGTSPDEADEYGRTALIYAVMVDSLPLGQMLVNHGANLNIHDKLGKTALHWAVERGSIDMMRLLLGAKAMVDAQNQQGITPLMVAASKGRAEAVRLLMQFHADPRKNDYTGRDAVDWANNAAIVRALKVSDAR